MAIRDQGGVTLTNGDRVIPDPILVGRNEEKIAALAQQYQIERWTTDLDGALSNPDDIIFFDAATTQARPGLLKKAIAAGKHVYSEKPVAVSLEEALDLYHFAQERGVKHGVVQDKLWLPGLQKLQLLNSAGFLAGHCQYAVNLVTGYLKAICSQGNALPGITVNKTVAASFWI